MKYYKNIYKQTVIIKYIYYTFRQNTMKTSSLFLGLFTIVLSSSYVNCVTSSSLLSPFRRRDSESSIDHSIIAAQSQQLQDHARRLESLELTISQIQVHLNAQLPKERRPSSSLQRRPEIRRSSRSDTSSVPSIRRFPSDYSNMSNRLIPPPSKES